MGGGAQWIEKRHNILIIVYFQMYRVVRQTSHLLLLKSFEGLSCTRWSGKICIWYCLKYFEGIILFLGIPVIFKYKKVIVAFLTRYYF